MRYKQEAKHEKSITKRDYSLDALKVIATIGVIELHAGFSGVLSGLLFYLCGFSLPIFFMVSGALTLNRSKGISWEYVVTRAIKIIFLLVLWNVPFVMIRFLMGDHVNPLEYTIRALFQRGVLWHFWYLWSLLFLLFFSPFLAKWLKDEKKVKWITGILLTICFVLSLLTIFMSLRGIPTIEDRVPQTLRLWSHITYYWLGAVIYKNIKSGNLLLKLDYYKWICFIIFSLMAAVFQYVMCTKVLMRGSPENLFTNPIILLWISIIFIIVCSLDLSEHSKIIEFGLVSMGMYILHPLIMLIFQYLGIWDSIYWFLRFVILLLGSSVLSWIMNKIPVVRRLIRL